MIRNKADESEAREESRGDLGEEKGGGRIQTCFCGTFQDLLKSGYPCLSLHGGEDYLDRDHTLHEFKSGIKTVMVATSVAGRDHLCDQLQLSNHLEEYVHRVGRTGRAGRRGVSYTFLQTSEEDDEDDLREGAADHTR